MMIVSPKPTSLPGALKLGIPKLPSPKWKNTASFATGIQIALGRSNSLIRMTTYTAHAEPPFSEGEEQELAAELLAVVEQVVFRKS